MDALTVATPLLTRAVNLDNDERFTEALCLYQEGIQILMEALKTFANEDPKKIRIRAKTEEYMARAEKVKKHVEDLKDKGSYRERIQVSEGASGFSYQQVLSRFLDEDVTCVEIDDPYIRSPHQCDNFVRFLELCIKKSSRLASVVLTTGTDTNNAADQAKRLDSIRRSLTKIPQRKYGINLRVEYSDSLHDREIRLDNGWVVKIGRGLDYFKQMDRFNIGFTDFDLRQCRETTIDVFHKSELQRIK